MYSKKVLESPSFFNVFFAFEHPVLQYKYSLRLKDIVASCQYPAGVRNMFENLVHIYKIKKVLVFIEIIENSNPHIVHMLIFVCR